MINIVILTIKLLVKVGIKQFIIDELNISANYGTGYNVPTTLSTIF